MVTPAKDPTSQLKVTWNGTGKPIKVHLWDKDGVDHDISAHFISSAGKTQRTSSGLGTVTADLVFHKNGNGYDLNLKFVPDSRVITWQIPENVVGQLMQLLV